MARFARGRLAGVGTFTAGVPAADFPAAGVPAAADFSMWIVIVEQVNFVSPWMTTTLPE